MSSSRSQASAEQLATRGNQLQAVAASALRSAANRRHQLAVDGLGQGLANFQLIAAHQPPDSQQCEQLYQQPALMSQRLQLAGNSHPQCGQQKPDCGHQQRLWQDHQQLGQPNNGPGQWHSSARQQQPQRSAGGLSGLTTQAAGKPPARRASGSASGRPLGAGSKANHLTLTNEIIGGAEAPELMGADQGGGGASACGAHGRQPEPELGHQHQSLGASLQYAAQLRQTSNRLVHNLNHPQVASQQGFKQPPGYMVPMQLRPDNCKQGSCTSGPSSLAGGQSKWLPAERLAGGQAAAEAIRGPAASGRPTVNFNRSSQAPNGLDEGDESAGESRKKKYLTAKYGQQQMNLIKKRLKIEMWLYEKLQDLAKEAQSQADLDEIDIDLDQLLDLDDDATRRRWLKQILEPFEGTPEHRLNEFIDQVLEQSKLL